MRFDWLMPAILVILLTVTAVSIVASRLWMQNADRDLRNAERAYQELLTQEQMLRVEWVSRTDLNEVERRAREELGMRPPRPDQWYVVKP